MLAVLAMVLAAGCATSEPVEGPAEKLAAEMICSQERPTGSHIAVTKCQTAAQIEKARENAARALGSPTRDTSPIIAAPGS